jgi:hypothetical protein
VGASVEALFNVNAEDAPYVPEGEIGPGEDTRVNAKVSVTSKLFEDISVRFGFTAKYDHAPAPLPNVAGLPIDPGNPILAETLDTITDVTVIVNFL